ncbi:DUF4411 family protein [Dyella soli]|uniref:DUF4411 family protein n=1 Tax=Dyella soli TaxID=522319 RepID=A0A4R0YG30_9GAMM|nr:DUF4411 family protein [Dyella soli]TCI07154.1 DUF4411 family protein [Dyella soli]
MRVFDASSIIYGWDNYPIQMFPRLWLWLEDEIAAGRVGIPEVAYDEVGHMSPDCHAWLKAAHVQVIDITEATLQAASAIKDMLGVQADAYHADGVDENDLLVIACARVHGHELVSDEKDQPVLPQNKKRYKIPAVCKQPGVMVPCANFLGYLKASNAVF